MATHQSKLTKHEAIARAVEYLKAQQLSDDLEIHKVYYSPALDDEEWKQMEADLGRSVNSDERRLFQMHNKSRWVVQFVIQPCPRGETPQDPKVLVNDDGTVSHFRPM